MARRKKQPLKISEGKSDKAIFAGVKFAAVPYSNFVGGQYIDRMYGTHTGVRLVQKDGSEYAGAIHTKKESVTDETAHCFGKLYMSPKTADGLIIQVCPWKNQET